MKQIYNEKVRDNQFLREREGSYLTMTQFP